MKKIFLTCLGVCLTSTVPAIADDFEEGMQKGFLCIKCIEAANAFRHLVVNWGIRSCADISGDSYFTQEYKELQQLYSESIRYDAEFLGKEAEGEFVIRYMDKLAQDACSGVPAAQSCKYYAMCLCETKYYGEPIDEDETNGYSGFLCVKCPSDGTSRPGMIGINACYVPAGTGGTDSAGTWEYVSDCYYGD